jgi:hypothetical protein
MRGTHEEDNRSKGGNRLLGAFLPWQCGPEPPIGEVIADVGCRRKIGPDFARSGTSEPGPGGAEAQLAVFSSKPIEWSAWR